MKLEQRWQVLAALSLARVSMGFQFQSVASTAPLLSGSLGLDQAQIGWLVGLYLLPGVALALPGGMLGARFGDKRIVLLGLLLMTAGGLGFALASDIAEASIARAVMGVGAVLLNVLLAKMVTDWFAGKELVLAMSILINTWPIGIGIALLTLGAVAQSVSWQAAFVVTAGVAALGMAIVFFGCARAPGAPSAQGIDLRSLTRREWILVGAAGLPWMVYNAGYALLVAFYDPGHRIGPGRWAPGAAIRARRLDRPLEPRRHGSGSDRASDFGYAFALAYCFRADRRVACRSIRIPARRGPARRVAIDRNGNLLHHLLRRNCTRSACCGGDVRPDRIERGADLDGGRVFRDLRRRVRTGTITAAIICGR